MNQIFLVPVVAVTMRKKKEEGSKKYLLVNVGVVGGGVPVILVK